MRKLITAAFALAFLVPGLAASGHVHQATDAAHYSPYFKVRVAAARLLTGREDEASRKGLWRLAEDSHPLVRLTALHGLIQLGGTDAWLAHRRATVDPHPRVRAYELR